MSRIQLIPPAASLMGSMRGVGYDAKTAVADLIDNSISADARIVWLSFNWAGAGSTVGILDDGHGMSPEELERAMTLGSSHPKKKRDAGDLGRFGLGLKTASLSQCKRFMVATKREGQPIVLMVWDLDVVEATNDWVVESTCREAERSALERLEGLHHGTLVLWSNLDRLLGEELTEDAGLVRDFQRIASEVETHLEMTFHRFLEGPSPSLRLYINGTDDEFRVKSWDPFYQRNPATQQLPTARRGTRGGQIELQGYVLPHKDRVPSSEAEMASGPNGWIGQQGFYVYRNRRLLVAGSWLGLGRPRRWGRDEQHKLARIRLDLPNSMDATWALNITKSTAKPPPALREWLTRMAEQVRDPAREVFVHRGQRATPGPKATYHPLWLAGSGMAPVYYINRDHPTVKAFIDGSGTIGIRALLTLLESTVPVHRIWLDVSDKPEAPRPASTQVAEKDILALARDLVRSLMGQATISRERAVAQLRSIEPFDQFPHILAELESE